jgi:hypothetical protein
VPLAKFVGTYTDDSGVMIDVDLHRGALAARMADSPDRVSLAALGDHRFRIEGASSAILLEFDVLDDKVTAATLQQGPGKGSVRLRWNP